MLLRVVWCLDGWSIILIALFEAVLRRQINRRIEQAVTKVGLAIIVGVMVYILLSALQKIDDLMWILPNYASRYSNILWQETGFESV